MNKAELIEVLTKELDTDRRSATDAVEHFVNAIVRAVHKGLGERSQLRYDAIGFYEDEWVLLPQGWRIQKRSMTMLLDMGDKSVLQPAP